MVKGISFDFWDTLFIDDSDEKKRMGLGLCSKIEERFQLLEKHLSFNGDASSFLKSAITFEKNWFEVEWKSKHRTPPVEKRIKKICEHLKINISKESTLEIASKFENMEVEIQPDPLESCFNTLKELGKDYKLAITSDTIYTPGQGIKKILNDHGMLNLFECFSFSNEVGFSKPQKEIFLNTLNNLGLGPEEVVHIGDRLYNDVFGGQRSGLKTIWLNWKGTNQGESAQDIKADFEIKSLGELPRVLRELSS